MPSDRQLDRSAEPDRNFALQCFKLIMGIGPKFNKLPVTASYLTPQKALEIAALAQFSLKKKKESFQISQVQILLKFTPASRFHRFCFRILYLCVLYRDAQDMQMLRSLGQGEWLNLSKASQIKAGKIGNRERIESVLAQIWGPVLAEQLPSGLTLEKTQCRWLWPADSTDVQQLSAWLILTSCSHGYKRQICWHFYFQPPGCDKRSLQIAHVS